MKPVFEVWASELVYNVNKSFLFLTKHNSIKFEYRMFLIIILDEIAGMRQISRSIFEIF